jgi:hypothetical protein
MDIPLMLLFIQQAKKTLLFLPDFLVKRLCEIVLFLRSLHQRLQLLECKTYDPRRV